MCKIANLTARQCTTNPTLHTETLEHEHIMDNVIWYKHNTLSHHASDHNAISACWQNLLSHLLHFINQSEEQQAISIVGSVSNLCSANLEAYFFLPAMATSAASVRQPELC